MVLLCHDISDILMEAAKLCKYAGLETASTALFVAFMVTWLLARLTYYPFWIIHSTLCALIARASTRTEIYLHMSLLPLAHTVDGKGLRIVSASFFWPQSVRAGQISMPGLRPRKLTPRKSHRHGARRRVTPTQLSHNLFETWR